jgi:hypothetical protein
VGDHPLRTHVRIWQRSAPLVTSEFATDGTADGGVVFGAGGASPVSLSRLGPGDPISLTEMTRMTCASPPSLY